VFDDENPSFSMLVARTVLNKFFTAYVDIKNPAKHMDYYKQKFCYYGKRIKYFADGKKHTGKIVDVDKKNCMLEVQGADGKNLYITSPSSIIIPQKSSILDLLTSLFDVKAKKQE
jgi:hypothetical protein